MKKAKKKPVRVRYYVGRDKGSARWRVRRIERGLPIADRFFRTKREAITDAKLGPRLGERASIYVCGKDGKYRCEWTYPRPSDPRRTKG